MSLPIFTTVEDVNSIASYLRNKPVGATIAEAKAVLKEVAEGRKISAFVFWGVVTRDGEKIKLTQRGWDIARKTRTHEQVFLEILDHVVPYRSVLEWAYHQKLESITNADVASYWHDHHSDATGSDNENTIKDQAVCFFRIAEAAGIGKFSIGRRGSATRLDVNRVSITHYIDVGPVAPPLVESMDFDEAVSDAPTEIIEPVIETPPLVAPEPAIVTEPSQAVRVFITHGKNMELVEQVETVLQIAEIDYEVAVKEESSAIPVSEKVFSAMRRCSAGVIIVSAEQVNNGSATPHINPNVLIEIGAAFVLYDRKVILIWEKGVPVPSNLQGLYRCEFEGTELGWTSGMKLMKAMKEFR